MGRDIPHKRLDRHLPQCQQLRSAGVACAPQYDAVGRSRLSIKDEVAVLRAVQPFSELDETKLKLLAFMSDHVVYKRGEVIIRQGEPGDVLFVLIEGLVEISIVEANGARQVSTMGRHTFFGEIAVMKKTLRAATVKAETEASALRISKDVLYKMIEAEPELGRRIAAHIDASGYTYS
jgi:CRP-like cAMP-binding protein